jgi:cysteine synthase
MLGAQKLLVVLNSHLRVQQSKTQAQQVQDGVLGCIGNTPMLVIKSLSDATGCRILAKAELLNPGGSIKDRVARQIVLDAEQSGRLAPGATITEGTAGSTGVALAMVAAARGYRLTQLLFFGECQKSPLG